MGDSFDVFWTEFGVVSGCTLELGLVSVIVVSGCGWPLHFDLDRHVAFLVFSFAVEGQFFLNILAFLRI